jgi:hypothetical protein
MRLPVTGGNDQLFARHLRHDQAVRHALPRSRDELAPLRALLEGHLRSHPLVTTVTSPLCKSFTATSLCGFLLLRNSADAIATALMSR